MNANASVVCPRCGGGFHCGASDADPCACSALQLDAIVLADLRARYSGCLCLACLRQIGAAKPASATADLGHSPAPPMGQWR